MAVSPTLHVKRLPDCLLSDDRRVITRLFNVGSEARVLKVIERVLALSDAEVDAELKVVLRDFATRHKNLERVFEEHFADVASRFLGAPERTRYERRLLIGAYFTMEYAIESAALFNPSIVPHPNQDGVPAGGLRFILSLRATGEGHVSSLAFRTGMILPNKDVTFHRTSRYVEAAKKSRDHLYHKHTFFLKLSEMGTDGRLVRAVRERLEDKFPYPELCDTITHLCRSTHTDEASQQIGERMRWLARSNYALRFPDDCDISEVVIFPVSENESRGIEDARLVPFAHDDGGTTYYATYTAYNGFDILPMLLQTKDFHRFHISTLNGQYAQNKGAALFPRKIDGLFTMVSRVDGENLYLMQSENLHFWNEVEPLQTPTYPWEFVQIGNCGSPLETSRGWLLLTHGVGPMRRYCIGATVLDLEDPRRVIAQSRTPLMMPNDREREGYVPNVLYTCGALIHDGTLFMPYAMSDSATSVATIEVDELLDYLISAG